MDIEKELAELEALSAPKEVLREYPEIKEAIQYDDAFAKLIFASEKSSLRKNTPKQISSLCFSDQDGQ